MTSQKRSHQILKDHYLKLKKENSKFSMRALSQKLGISHSFLVGILNGKKKIPMDRFGDLCKALKVDEFEQNKLKKSLLLEANQLMVPEFFSESKNPQTEVEQLPGKHLGILRRWWNLAILELIACYGSRGISEEVLIEKMPVSKKEVLISLNQLQHLDLIQLKNGKYIKTKQHLKIGTHGPHEITRDFYQSTLDLARKSLDQKQPEDFEKRLITAISCSVNPRQIPRAKIRLMEVLAEVRDILTEGECTEVYFLQAQLFSVLK